MWEYTGKIGRYLAETAKEYRHGIAVGACSLILAGCTTIDRAVFWVEDTLEGNGSKAAPASVYTGGNPSPSDSRASPDPTAEELRKMRVEMGWQESQREFREATEDMARFNEEQRLRAIQGNYIRQQQRLQRQLQEQQRVLNEQYRQMNK